MTKFRIMLGTGLIGLTAACAPAAPDQGSDVASDAPATETVSAVPETTTLPTPPASPHEIDAVAPVINRNGDSIGSAALYQGTEGVIMRLAVSGLTPGIHGMHFHTVGTCEDPQDGFMATGGHVMPLGKPHGYMHPDGPHAGNLPNLIVHSDGTATVELYTSIVSLFEGPAALLDEDGATLIIHENEDDHLTQPIGGAGGRVACGVVQTPS